MRRVRARRLVVPVWKSWLMNQPFRVFGVAHRGFGPGAGNALEYVLRLAWHRLYERERLKWWIVRLRGLFS